MRATVVGTAVVTGLISIPRPLVDEDLLPPGVTSGPGGASPWGAIALGMLLLEKTSDWGQSSSGGWRYLR